MRMKGRAIGRIGLLLVLGWIGISSGVAHAVPIGFIFFDSLIPADPPIPGVNAFSIHNLTGNPTIGGFALPPDFPVLDLLTFTGSTLTLTLEDGTTQAISLGDIGPGPLLDPLTGSPPPALQLPDTTNILSATFTATLSQRSFLLEDGTTFEAASSLISTTLSPSFGPFLTAGLDFAVLDVAQASPGGEVPIPEPGSLALMGSGLAGLWAWRRRRPRPCEEMS